MDFAQWLDPLSVALVLGGTMAAALLRCGWRDTRTAAKAVAQLLQKPFAFDAVRAELGLQIQEIAQNGLVRARPHQFGDVEFDALADALIRRRSLVALRDEHERFRATRLAEADTAVAVLGQAADLAPVLGLAGTLLSLGGLSAATAAGGDTAQAIGIAVTTTLYGLIAAHFLFAPLSAAVARRARAEDDARQVLLGWLEDAVRQAHPGPISAEAEPAAPEVPAEDRIQAA